MSSRKTSKTTSKMTPRTPSKQKTRATSSEDPIPTTPQPPTLSMPTTSPSEQQHGATASQDPISIQPPQALTTTMPSTSQSPTSTKGYIHLLSPIKTAPNSAKTTYFDMTLQTSPTNAQRVVCYDPQRRNDFKNFQEKKMPIEIRGGNYSPNKRNAQQLDLAIRKKSKVTIKSTVLDYPFHESFSTRLIQIAEIASKSSYDTIDLKAKVITKGEEKQKIIVRGQPCFKAESMVGDQTGTIRLELWEDAIDKVQRGKSYHFENIKVKTFDDVKYVNTTLYTKITSIDDMEVGDFSLPDMQENFIKGKIVGVDLTRKDCCLFCNANVRNETTDDEIINCDNCNNSFLRSMLKSKLVCKLIVQIHNNMLHYTAFNDALESFLLLDKTCNKSLNDVSEKELKLLLLKSSSVSILVDQSTKVITQFM